MLPLPLTYMDRDKPIVLLVPLILHNNTLQQVPHLLQVQRKYQTITFITIIESYLKRYYDEGPMDIVTAQKWSESMFTQWHYYLEGQITLELDEPPETNVQMATDILYAYEHYPEVIVHLVNDMINTANATVIYHLDQFLKTLSDLNVGVELSSVQLDTFGSVQINFLIASPDVIRIWQDDPRNVNGGLYALI